MPLGTVPFGADSGSYFAVFSLRARKTRHSSSIFSAEKMAETRATPAKWNNRYRSAPLVPKGIFLVFRNKNNG